MAASAQTRRTRASRSEQPVAVDPELLEPKKPSTEVIPWTIESSTIDLLQPYGLKLLLPWRVLVCDRDNARCLGVGYQQVTSHREIHRGEKQRNTGSLSEEAREKLEALHVIKVLADFPVPTGIVAPIPFLPVLQGFQCIHPQCNLATYVHTSMNVMGIHFRASHPKVPGKQYLPRFLQRVMCQSFGLPNYFQVAVDVPLQDFAAASDMPNVPLPGEPARCRGRPKVPNTLKEFIRMGEAGEIAATSQRFHSVAHEDDDFEAFQRFLTGHTHLPPEEEEEEEMLTAEITSWATELEWGALIGKADFSLLKERLGGSSGLRQAVERYIRLAMGEIPRVNKVTLAQLLQKTSQDKKVLFLEAKNDIQSHISTWNSFLGMVLRDCRDPIPHFPRHLSPTVGKCAKALFAKLSISADIDVLAGLVHALIFEILSAEDAKLSRMDNSPLFRFVAINSHLSASEIVDPTTATSKMAPLQYVFRLAVLWQGCLDARSGASIETCIGKYIPLIRTESSHRTWQTLQHMKGVASRQIYKTSKQLRIEWTADGSELTYGSQRIQMSALHNFFHAIQAAGRSHLHDVVLESILPEKIDELWAKIPFDYIWDDITCPDVNYSFLRDPKNALPAGNHYPLLELLMESRPGHFGKRSNVAGDPIEWDAANISDWCREADKTLGFHMMGNWTQFPGTPRGTEMVELKLKNLSTRERELFYLDGHLTFISGRNKTTNQSGYDKSILRTPNKDLGNQQIFYLIFIRPLLVLWAPIAYPDVVDASQTYEEYMWVTGGRKWISKDITDTLRHFTQEPEYLGTAIGIHEWRHIIIAIVRKHLVIRSSVLEEVLAGENSKWKDPDSTADWNDPALLREYATFCNKWHRFWGFDRKDNTTALFLAPEMDQESWNAVRKEMVESMKRNVVLFEKGLHYLNNQRNM
ncbi:hypothetical protein C8F04DRAFT_1289060 [Mycena alexandri]|uniref:Uncharacterized protein n=1 Tax=Mycena alexandri TaxID=1745969 RepID=A0AAD6X1S1_9AGAR|nr:hypothetical protein C8F04DRAFT_1289060 [Mycena alexandri]